MRKSILSLVLLIMAASFGPMTASEPDSTAVRTRAGVVADSLVMRGQRLGQKVVEGALVVAGGALEAADSIQAAGERFGEKAKVWGDSLSVRSRRAWKAWNAGRDGGRTQAADSVAARKEK